MIHIAPNTPVSEEIEALHHLIRQTARLCGLDLENRAAVRRLLDDEQENGCSESASYERCQELKAMLVLLYRLEASNSEDLGVEGLRRLWRQHNKILARFYIGDIQQTPSPSRKNRDLLRTA